MSSRPHGSLLILSFCGAIFPGRRRRFFQGVGLHLFHHLFDHFFQLRVATLRHKVGVVPDFKIGFNAYAFVEPFTGIVVQTGVGNGDAAVVDELVAGSGAYEDTQGTFADNRAAVQFAKSPGQPVAARAGPSVDQHAHRAWIGLCREPVVPSVAPVKVIDNRAFHQFQKTVGELAAAVETLINDESFFIQLPVKQM